MKKSILLLLAIPLLASCASKNYGYGTGTNSGTTNTTTNTTTTTNTGGDTTGGVEKYTTLTNEGVYKFEVVDGHAYAKYTPKCVSDAYFTGEGSIFESEFISWVKIHPFNNPNSDIGDAGYMYGGDEETEYWLMSTISVSKEFVNKEVLIDFCIDTNYMENGSKFELSFLPEEHSLNFTGECSCGHYKSDKIYIFDFTKQLSITLEPGETAYLKFDTPRDNFVLYFYSTMEITDLDTGVEGFTPHGVNILEIIYI